MVAAVFVLAFLVAIIGIAVMVVVVRKKREADRLERESRDLVLAFDDYNYDDDELDDIDDINDDVRLLKLGKNERHSKQFKHDDGSIPV